MRQRRLKVNVTFGVFIWKCSYMFYNCTIVIQFAQCNYLQTLEVVDRITVTQPHVSENPYFDLNK